MVRFGFNFSLNGLVWFLFYINGSVWFLCLETEPCPLLIIYLWLFIFLLCWFSLFTFISPWDLDLVFPADSEVEHKFFCFFSVLEVLLSISFFCLQSTFFASFMCFDVLPLVPPGPNDRRVSDEDDENSAGAPTNGR